MVLTRKTSCALVPKLNPAQQAVLIKPGPGRFWEFGNWIVRVGTAIACEKYLDKWGQSVINYNNRAIDGETTVEASFAREYFPATMERDSKEMVAHFSAHLHKEVADLERRKDTLNRLRETKLEYQYYVQAAATH